MTTKSTRSASSKTRSKSSSSPKKTTSSQGSTAQKKTSRTPARKPKTTRSSPASSRRRLAPSSVRGSTRKPMSTDRKLDIVGVVLVLSGILTFLSLLSPIRGSVTGYWVMLIGRGFGWGMYLLPVLLIGAGLWLVLRNFEKFPRFDVERVFGFVLLFVWFLAAVHFVVGMRSEESMYQIATNGEGGGYLGAVSTQVLQTALGDVGAGVALVSIFLIAAVLALDLSIYQIFNWINTAFRWIWSGLLEGWRTMLSWLPRKPEDSLDPEFTPLHRSLTESIETRTASADLPPQEFSPLSPDSGKPWVLPPISQILDAGEESPHNAELDVQRGYLIEETLRSFGAPVKVTEINRGPTITQFGVEPDFIESRSGRMRVRVSKIVSLADDLALALSARTVRIQAPVPGKGFVGIEVPNEVITPVMLRDVLENERFVRITAPLRFALGQNVAGQAIAYDLANMPHLLIAGATGAGKSVCVNSIICCLLMNNTPDDLRLIMVDPKRVELSGYNGIPHLLSPVVVDLEKVVSVLQWVTREMDMRYRKLSEAGVRNIQEYNARAQPGKRIPYLVAFIDELADLMMLAPDETERTITRLAQMSRATGIHLVIATQRPSVEVVTGLIKANFPARIAFAVVSNTDSRVILDQPGAERLLGRGDMLFQAPDAAAPVRLQGVFVSDLEIFRLVTYWQSFAGTVVDSQPASPGAPDALPTGIPLRQKTMWEEIEDESEDPLFKEAVDISRRQGRASISMLQRRLRIGYTRAARLVERMEEKGIVGSPEPVTGTREILDYGEAAPPVDNN